MKLQHPPQQRGVVLILAIVVLVAMSLAAVALMRSVYTGNQVAGNLAFQQSATLSADSGVEAAVAWLEQNRLGTTLQADATGSGYYASRLDPTTAQNGSWETWWTATMKPTGVVTLGADGAGNVVSYVIQRMCNEAGDPASNIGCQTAPSFKAGVGGSQSTGTPPPSLAPVQYYYRITSRVAGARNTVSYVQVVVTM